MVVGCLTAAKVAADVELTVVIAVCYADPPIRMGSASAVVAGTGFVVVTERTMVGCSFFDKMARYVVGDEKTGHKENAH